MSKLSVNPIKNLLNTRIQSGNIIMSLARSLFTALERCFNHCNCLECLQPIPTFTQKLISQRAETAVSLSEDSLTLEPEEETEKHFNLECSKHSTLLKSSGNLIFMNPRTGTIVELCAVPVFVSLNHCLMFWHGYLTFPWGLPSASKKSIISEVFFVFQLIQYCTAMVG